MSGKLIEKKDERSPEEILRDLSSVLVRVRAIQETVTSLKHDLDSVEHDLVRVLHPVGFIDPNPNSPNVPIPADWPPAPGASDRSRR
jgi:hypothetical protein